MMLEMKYMEGDTHNIFIVPEEMKAFTNGGFFAVTRSYEKQLVM